MAVPAHPFTLVHWRRSVAEQYAAVRAADGGDARAAALRFRAAREQLFRDHDDSPIAPERRPAWPGLAWFAYDPSWRVTSTMRPWNGYCGSLYPGVDGWPGATSESTIASSSTLHGVSSAPA